MATSSQVSAMSRCLRRDSTYVYACKYKYVYEMYVWVNMHAIIMCKNVCVSKCVYVDMWICV